jgi:succinate dehydrogenase / fumarate reductase iron-sulfur subunit
MDSLPRTHEYTISPREGESILDLLLRIKHTQDGSLTFRGSCGYGGCGSCGIKANGKHALACVTQVKDVLDAHSGLRIDPLHENVIKDLVVDEREFFQQLLKVKPWITPRKNDEKRNHKMGINDVKKMGNTPQCILCGICDARVESSQKGEMGPASFVKAYRYIHDIRDGNMERPSVLCENLPVHYSLSLANECPRDIRPGDIIHELRPGAEPEKRMKSDKNTKTMGKR